MLKLFVRTAFTAATICAATAAFADAAPASTGQTSKGATLVDAKGKSLYTFDKDEGGKSSCSGQCAVNWPPLIAPSGSSASGEWTIVSREDGSAQWAYKGQPLYTFIKDEKPGDANGDDLKNVWHLVKP